MSNKNQLKSLPLLYIAFFEGAAVMAVELGGAKLIAPFYGTSLFVWSAVLAITLGGLTTGYYFGGLATKKFQPYRLLMTELIIAFIWMLLMPFIALHFMPLTKGLGVRTGSLVSAMMILMPALVCMGMVSPTIIQLANKNLMDSGKTAGTVYAVSTIGGILMTLFLGFYALPELGIRLSLWLSAIPLLLFATLLMPYAKVKKIYVLLILISIIFFTTSTVRNYDKPMTDFTFLYKSEGILGQLSVLSNPIDERTTHRHMFINHIAQTYVNEDSLTVSMWDYPHRFATIASLKPPNSKALLIGLGGGSIAQEFIKLGFDIDAVELDKRIPKIAKDFFDLQLPENHIYVDDGRHFIQYTKKTYDVVFIDVLNGENQPHHMFTKESIQTLKKILSKDAILMINLQGYIKGEKGKGTRSVFKTLVSQGFDVGVFQSKEGGDVHLYATKGKVDLSTFSSKRQNDCCKAMKIGLAECISAIKIDTLDAEILVDNKPLLEYYSAKANEEWRETALNAIIKRELENDYPFFD